MFKKTLAAFVLSAGMIFGGSSYSQDIPSINPQYKRDQILLPKIGAQNSVVEGLEKEIQDNFRKRLVDTVRQTGLRGGYIKLPEDFYDGISDDIAYSYHEGRNNMLPREKLEEQISKLIRCKVYNDLEPEKMSFWVIPAKPDVKTKIEKDSVRSYLKFPVNIITKEGRFKLRENYETRIDVRLGEMLDIVNGLVERMIKKRDPIIIDNNKSSPYFVMVFSKEDDNRIFYSLTDERKLDNIPFSLLFAAKFGKERLGNTNVTTKEKDYPLKPKTKLMKFIDQTFIDHAFSETDEIKMQPVRLSPEQMKEFQEMINKGKKAK